MQIPTHADTLLRRIAGPTGLLAERYRPIEVLGQGGMGIVFSAVDERLARDVAIKSLRPDLAGDRDFVARFAAEASALARLHHPNVVQIIDVAEGHAGVTYYVMELVHGTALSQLLRDRGRLPWAQAFDILSQVAGALATIHKAGVVHRDLKPSNLLCTELGHESWHVKLIDFGIAIAAGGPRLTRPGEVLGTLPYMAPEQFAGGVIDRRTDVYGWGVLALELLGGVPPVELFGNEALAGAPLRESARRVLEQARVRPYIIEIVCRCLATQPDERWSAMDAVFAELRERDDGGAPTLIFQRVPLPPDALRLLEDPRTRSLQGDVAGAPTEDDARTRVQPRVGTPEHPSAPGHASASGYPSAAHVSNSGLTPVAHASHSGLARVGADDHPAASSRIERRAPTPPRSQLPTVLAATLLVLSLVLSAAWVAHARGWWPPRSAKLTPALSEWPQLPTNGTSP